MTQPKLHHYVPRLLLKRFGKERKRGKFFTSVFDKQQERTFDAGVEKILAESKFNEVDTTSGKVTIEPYTAEREGAFGAVLAKLLQHRSISGLNDSERTELFVFTAMQYLRGTGFRNSAHDMQIRMRDRLLHQFDPQRLPDELRHAPDELDKKIFGIDFLISSLEEIAVHLSQKDILLMEANNEHEFILGDNPVVLHNSKNFGPYGNIGFAVTGIEIYFPVSPCMLIAFWCPTLVRGLREGIAEGEHLVSRLKARATIMSGSASETVRDQLAKAQGIVNRLATNVSNIDKGTPLVCDRDNVDYVNSLQVSYAERYVISRSGDHRLAKETIKSNPKLKQGRRMEIC